MDAVPAHLTPPTEDRAALDERVLAEIARRNAAGTNPTPTGVAHTFGLEVAGIAEPLESLRAAGRITARTHDGFVVLTAAAASSPDPVGAHEITVERGQGLRDGGAWYRARCSCSRYASGLHAYLGKAESAGLEHKRVMEASRG